MGFGVDIRARRGIAFFGTGMQSDAPEIDPKRTSDVGGRWPLGVIKYYVPASLDVGYAVKVRKTMRRWETCILAHSGRQLVKFVELPSTFGDAKLGQEALQGVVKIVDNDSRADIGYLKGRPQIAGVNIKKNAALITSLPHELGHCIGLAHEHERNDAEAGVRRYMQEKIGGKELAANSNVKYATLGTPFDRMSIMMYPTEAGKILTAEQMKNSPAGGCDITEAQVDAANWWPSPGDLNFVRLLYGRSV